MIGKTLYAKTEGADRVVIERVNQIAQARGVPMAQVALAWLLSRPGVTAPIVGATSRIIWKTPQPPCLLC